MFTFADSFDLYAAPADAINGYWDSGTVGFALVAGRFTGSLAAQNSGNTAWLTKASGNNDAVHHIVCAYRQTAAISGTTLGLYLQLVDGTTNQCCIVFRSDGAILLTSGGPAGTALATYTGAVAAINTWYAFECEVVINSTTGSFTVRKNGNTSNDFTLGSLNTRGGTANNYANKLTVGQNATLTNTLIDDLFWRSDPSAVAWMGDIRCYTRMPATDQSVQFTRQPTSFFAQSNAGVSTGSLTSGIIRGVPVAAPTTGVLASLQSNFSAGITGHAKMALYDGGGVAALPGAVGALLGSSAELTNPGAGINTFTVTGGPTVQRGAWYWIMLWSDVAITGTGNNPGSGNVAQFTLPYTTSFPSSLAGYTTTNVPGIASNGMNVTPFNAGCVNETQEDALTSYVFDATVGHADLYGIGSIAATPSSVIAVTTRGYMQKSDAGSRTASVQIKSGATTVATPTLTLSSSGWLWAWRTDTTDPNTSAAWTASGVNNAQIGPLVVS